MRLFAIVEDKELGYVSFEAAKELADLTWADVWISPEYQSVEELYAALEAEAGAYDLFCRGFGIEPAFTVDDLIDDVQEEIDWLLRNGFILEDHPIRETEIQSGLKIQWNFSEK